MALTVWLERNDPRWEEAWAGLEHRFGDRVCCDFKSGECWQYMGSFESNGKLVSDFRHRDYKGHGRVSWRVHHPTTGVS